MAELGFAMSISVLLLLIVFIAVAAWLLPKLWRLLKQVFERIRCFIQGEDYTHPAAASDDTPTTLDVEAIRNGLPKQS